MRRRLAWYSALILSVATLAVAPAAEAGSGVVATGLTVPWGLGFLPDGSALVTERTSARILRLSPGGAPVVVATINGVVPAGEAGLLGLAVSPTYAQDGFVYVYFTAATDN